jgi:hypothetical protein
MGPRRLTPAQVRFIRKARDLRERISTAALAARYGVSKICIQHTACGLRYKDIR